MRENFNHGHFYLQNIPDFYILLRFGTEEMSVVPQYPSKLTSTNINIILHQRSLKLQFRFFSGLQSTEIKSHAFLWLAKVNNAIINKLNSIFLNICFNSCNHFKGVGVNPVH